METVSPELIAYVRSELSLGISQQKITEALLRVGWTDEQIAAVFHELSVPQNPSVPFIPSTTSTSGSQSLNGKK